MRAVLWDMDGTLVDSEKLWDIGIQEFYRRHDSELSPEVRASTVGGSAETVIGIVYLLLPWKRFLPGFILYQRYSPFFLDQACASDLFPMRCRHSFRNSTGPILL